MGSPRPFVGTIRAVGLAMIATIVLLVPSAHALPPGFNGNEVNDLWPTDPEYCRAWLAYADLQTLQYFGCDYAHNLLRNSGVSLPTNSCRWSISGVPSHRSPYTTRPWPPSGSITRGPSVEITFDVPIAPRDCDPYSAWFDVDGVIVKANMTKGPLHYRLSYTMEEPLAYHGSPGWRSIENPVGDDLAPIRPYTYHHVKAYLTYSWNSYNEYARFVGETQFFHTAEWVRVQGDEVTVYNDRDSDYEYDENQGENLVTVGPDRVKVLGTNVHAGFLSPSYEEECLRLRADSNPEDASEGAVVAWACHASEDSCVLLTHDAMGANPGREIVRLDPFVEVGTDRVGVCR